MTTYHPTKATARKLTDDVSPEDLITANVVINCILNNILCTSGIVGNTLNIIILSSPKFKDTTSFLLLSLSVADLLVAATQFIFRLPNVLWYLNPRLSDTVFCFYMTYLYTLNQIFLCHSIFFVTLVAVERMIAVCFPFRVTRLVTMFRVRLISVIGFFFFVLLLAPFLYMFYTWTYYDGNKVPYSRIAYTDWFLENNEILFFYRFVATVLFMYVIPMTCIIVSTVMIINTMALNWSSLKKLSSTNSEKRLKDMRSARGVLVVCLSMMIFILIPSFIFDNLTWFRPDLFPDNRNISTIVYYVMTIVSEFASFFNFIIYVATSPKFARQFKYLMCCLCKKQPTDLFAIIKK